MRPMREKRVERPLAVVGEKVGLIGAEAVRLATSAAIGETATLARLRPSLPGDQAEAGGAVL